MALPNKPVGELKAVRDPEVEEREVDILDRWRWYGCLRYRV
jgi:hypothetical protein